MYYILSEWVWWEKNIAGGGEGNVLGNERNAVLNIVWGRTHRKGDKKKVRKGAIYDLLGWGGGGRALKVNFVWLG